MFRQFPYTVERKKDILIINKKPLLKAKNINLDNLIEQLLIDEPIRRLSWDEYFHIFLEVKMIINFIIKLEKKLEKQKML